ncbi:hypothetical protein CR513_58404, partial [Mucuna pruriens]
MYSELIRESPSDVNLEKHEENGKDIYIEIKILQGPMTKGRLKRLDEEVQRRWASFKDPLKPHLSHGPMTPLGSLILYLTSKIPRNSQELMRTRLYQEREENENMVKERDGFATSPRRKSSRSRLGSSSSSCLLSRWSTCKIVSLGLLIYGLVLFPHLEDYIDLAAIDVFIAIREKRKSHPSYVGRYLLHTKLLSR